MSKDNLNNQRIRLEKLIKGSMYKDFKKDVASLVNIYKTAAYQKLLREDSTEDKMTLIGELRAVQKLLDVLELGSETTYSGDISQQELM